MDAYVTWEIVNVPRTEAINYSYFMAEVYEPVYDVGPDKAGPSGNQYACDENPPFIPLLGCRSVFSIKLVASYNAFLRSI